MKIIRGAICAENTEQSIAENSLLLVQQIMSLNNLDAKDIIGVFFTATDDLDAYYPATSVRTKLLPNAAFMCMQEMKVTDYCPQCIRVAVFAEMSAEPTHCYRGKASSLRPDLR